MITRTCMAIALLCSSATFAATPASTAKTQYNAEVKKAAQQYEADKKECSDEKDAEARLQCRRDAKTVYDNALKTAKANSTAAASKHPGTAACADCGTVTAVSESERDGEGSAVGMIAGGVGGGIGKDLATVAGAVGGAYAGKKIEEKVRAHKVWTVTVEYPDSSSRKFEFKEDPHYKAGDLVKNAGTGITRR